MPGRPRIAVSEVVKITRPYLFFFMCGTATWVARKAGREIRVDDLVPLRQRPVLERLADGHAGIGNENVEPAMLLGDAVDPGARGFLVGDVESRDVRAQAAIGQFLGDLAERFLAAAIEHDGSAAFSKPFGHGETETAGGTGDERYAVFEREERMCHVIFTLGG